MERREYGERKEKKIVGAEGGSVTFVFNVVTSHMSSTILCVLRYPNDHRKTIIDALSKDFDGFITLISMHI